MTPVISHPGSGSRTVVYFNFNPGKLWLTVKVCREEVNDNGKA